MLRCLLRLPRFAVAALLLGFAGTSPAATQQDHPAPDLAREVAQLTNDGHYPKALMQAQALARAVKTAVGEEHHHYAAALAWVASLYQMTGRYAEADPLLRQTLAIYQRVRPAGHADIATAINNIGFQHHSLGRYEEAEQHYSRALEMREKAAAPDDLAIADSLNNVAQIYKRLGRIEESEPLLRRSLVLRERRLGVDHPAIAQSLQNLASLLELRGRFDDAEPFLRKVLGIRRNVQGESHPETAQATAKLAQNLTKQQRFGEAEALFRTAVGLQRARDDAPARAPSPQAFSVVNSPGQPLNVRLGDGASATTLYDLALNQIELGKLDEAATLLRQVYAGVQSALTPTHPLIANTLMAQAEVASRLGRHQDALQSIRPATEIRIARVGEDDLARLNYLKHVRFAWHAHQAAAGGSQSQLADEALMVAQRAALAETNAAMTRMGARLSAKDKALGDLVRERDDLAGLQELIEQQLSRLMSLPREQRGDSEGELRRTLAHVQKRLTQIVERDIRAGFPDVSSLLQPEPLKAAQVRALLGPDEALVNVLCSYDETYVWTLTRETVRWHRVDRGPEQLSRAVAGLRASLAAEPPRPGAISSPPLFDLGEAYELYRQLLKPAEDAIAGKPHLMVVACGALTSLPFHVLVTEPPTVPRPTGRDLAAYRDAKWLARRHAISVLPALASLDSLRRRPRQGEPRRAMIGFARPQFAEALAPEARPPPGKKGGKPAAIQTRGIEAGTAQAGYAHYWRGPSADIGALRRDLAPLPETEGEVRTVARSLGGQADIRVGAAATETAVKRAALADYRVVYFATHGLLAGEVRGLGEPALALSLPAAPSDLDDGLLTASEVAQLKLNADWVVLAACNTAAGNAPGAEALSGLARAFFHAGARALLVSHWRVNSKAAARLTTAAFEAKRRDHRIGHAEAVRRAMLAMAADGKDPWNAYPAVWAPFIVVGEGAQ
jgi:CHAT domain-containing protein